MNDKPIIFSTLMVQAILENRKSQTRRVIKFTPDQYKITPTMQEGVWGVLALNSLGQPVERFSNIVCPYGKVGQKLWVRETFSEGYAIGGGDDNGNRIDVIYKASYEKHPNDCFDWKPSIFMPKRLSRITLEVTEVRVQRLQDITEEDAKAEGIPIEVDYPDLNVGKYSVLWDSINGKKYPWKSNPYVWAISFKRIQ